jgi:hypothetical protein
MEGAVEPPASVVVPEMVVFPRGLLAAGDDGECGLGHGDVVELKALAALHGEDVARKCQVISGRREK